MRVFFYGYTFLVNIVLFNLLVAIIGDSFERVRTRQWLSGTAVWRGSALAGAPCAHAPPIPGPSRACAGAREA